MPIKTKRRVGAVDKVVWKYWIAEWSGRRYRGGLLGWEIQIDDTPVGHRAFISLKFFPDITFCWSVKRGPWKWFYTRWKAQAEAEGGCAMENEREQR